MSIPHDVPTGVRLTRLALEQFKAAGLNDATAHPRTAGALMTLMDAVDAFGGQDEQGETPAPADDIPEFGPLYAMPGVMVLGDTLGQWTAPDGFVMVGVPMTRKSAADFLGLDVETMDTPDYDPRGSDPRARGAL